MADNFEKYIFSVDADTSAALDKLKKVNKMMDNIDKVKNKAIDNYFTTNQKDMDKNMRSMSELTKLYKELQTDLRNIRNESKKMANAAIPKSASEEQKKQIRLQKQMAAEQFQATFKQQQELDHVYQKSLKNFKSLSRFQQNLSRDFKHLFSSEDLFNLPTKDWDAARAKMKAMADDVDTATNRLDAVIAKTREVNKLDRRSESLSRRASASNYMSHQQAKSFEKDYHTVKSGYSETLEKNLDIMTKLGQQRTEITNQIKGIERNPDASQEEIDKKIALQRTIEGMDKEREARMELNRALQRTIENMKGYNESVQGVERKPERGTFRGMVYERAPAIGLALGGAAGYALTSLYQKGESVNDAMRPDVVSIGQRTDSDNWRKNIRDNAFDLGLHGDKLGFTGQEMLSFQDNYLSNMGFSNMTDLNTAAQSQAKFSRTTGLGADDTKQFFDSVYSTGAVNGKQTKDVQNAFIGAIKNSGMEGREKDQIDALDGILQSVKQGRSMTNDEVMNVMGLQSALSSSGERSLNGSSGGQLMQGLNEGIRQGFNNPMVRLAFGQGTKYQGVSGRFKLREQMDKGVSDVDNVNTIAKYAQSFGSDKDTQNEAFASFVQQGLGTDITAQQAKGLMDLYRKGSLSKDNISKVLENDKDTGKDVADKRYETYKNSKEATANESKATTDKQAANISDFGDFIKSANASLKDVPAPVYAAVAAVAALGVAAASSAAAFGGATLIRKGAGKKFTTGGTGGASGGGFFANMKGKIGGWFGKGGGGGGTPPTGGKSNGIIAKAGGLLGGASEGVAGAGKGLLKGGVSILGKAALPIAALLGIGEIASAPDDKKGSTTGSVIGGIGGGALGGAAAGAAAGSIIPGIGTAIGAIGGGIAGSLGGSSIGGWIGSKFDGGSKENKTEQQVDRENSTKKHQTENKKTDNLAVEKDNIHQYDLLLNRTQQLLAQARAQGGIFGSGGGVGAGTSTSASPVSGNSNAEKIWNFFSDKGMTPQAISGIMGNLQLESGLDPTATASNGAFGIGQWLGGRKTNLQNYAKKNGLSADSLEAQLNFMWHELNGGDSTTTSKLKKYGGVSGLSKMTSVSGAAKAFEDSFERSNGQGMSQRLSYAQDFYKQYGSAQFSKTPSASAKASGSVNSTITVNVKGDEKVSDKINNSKDMHLVAQRIQDKVYGSMNYYSKEMRTV